MAFAEPTLDIDIAPANYLVFCFICIRVLFEFVLLLSSEAFSKKDRDFPKSDHALYIIFKL